MSVPIIVHPSRSLAESYRVSDDALLVRLYNSLSGATFKVVARVLDPAGVLLVVQKDLTTTSDRTQQVTRMWLPTGQLVSVAVIATAGTPRRGQSWAVVSIESTLPSAVAVLTPLAQGYVTADSALLWPGGPYSSSVEGPGMLRSVTGTDPAAGAEISESVPTNARWRLLSLYALLTTDATVADRTAIFYIDDGTNVLMQLPWTTTQAASATGKYVVGEFATAANTIAGSHWYGLPAGIRFCQGWRIYTVTTGLVAGDNWGAPQMMVEEWIEE